MQQDCLILFRSLTYAQRAAHLLERGGVTATVRKAPLNLTDRGWTYGVRLREKRLERALALLKQRGVDHGKVFLMRADGDYHEVQP